MSKAKKNAIATSDVNVVPVPTTPTVALAAPAKKVTAKVSPFEAWVNLLLYMSANPKSAIEKMLATWFTDGMTKEPEVIAALEGLKIRGYVDDQYNITPYGVKLALTATSPTPNFNKVAEADFSSAVAMLFAAHEALVKKHNIVDNGIRPGKNTELCAAFDNVSKDIYDALVVGGYIIEK